MLNHNKAPEFPHVKYSENGKATVLNTSDNLKALLDTQGYIAKVNSMTLESNVFQSGECVVSPAVIRSDIVSLMSIHGLPKDAFEDHLSALAIRNTYHPVADWLEGDWDGVMRVDRVLECIRARNQLMANMVLKKWLIGCVASLYKPNFKSKLVPVLQGGQSFKKTAFVERIATVMQGAFLEGAELNPDNKDSVLAVIKSWIVELGELERSTKNCQGGLKAFITRSCDTVRPPYGRTEFKKPRQTNIIATVNGFDFLKDETGNSRYAVIELIDETDMDELNSILGWRYVGTGEVELTTPEKLRQFWLELKHLLLNEHASWMLTTQEQSIVSQESERFVDKGNWYNVLIDHISRCEGKARQWMSTTEICTFLNLDASRANSVGKALTLLTKEDVLEQKRLNGRSQYLFPTVANL